MGSLLGWERISGRQHLYAVGAGQLGHELL